MSNGPSTPVVIAIFVGVWVVILGALFLSSERQQQRLRTLVRGWGWQFGDLSDRDESHAFYGTCYGHPFSAWLTFNVPLPGPALRGNLLTNTPNALLPGERRWEGAPMSSGTTGTEATVAFPLTVTPPVVALVAAPHSGAAVTGDPAFDAQFLIQGGDPSILPRLLTAEVRQWLVEANLRPGMTVRTTPQSLQITAFRPLDTMLDPALSIGARLIEQWQLPQPATTLPSWPRGLQSARADSRGFRSFSHRWQRFARVSYLAILCLGLLLLAAGGVVQASGSGAPAGAYLSTAPTCAQPREALQADGTCQTTVDARLRNVESDSNQGTARIETLLTGAPFSGSIRLTGEVYLGSPSPDASCTVLSAGMNGTAQLFKGQLMLFTVTAPEVGQEICSTAASVQYQAPNNEVPLYFFGGALVVFWLALTGIRWSRRRSNRTLQVAVTA